MQPTKRSVGVTPEVSLRNIYHICLHQVLIRLPTLALKPKGDVTRSPKQRYQWPHKKDLPPLKFFNKNFLPRKCWHCNFGAIYYFHHGVSIDNLISGDFIFITRYSWNTVDIIRQSDVLVNTVKRPILCDREKTINIKFKRSETTW